MKKNLVSTVFFCFGITLELFIQLFNFNNITVFVILLVTSIAYFVVFKKQVVNKIRTMDIVWHFFLTVAFGVLMNIFVQNFDFFNATYLFNSVGCIVASSLLNSSFCLVSIKIIEKRPCIAKILHFIGLLFFVAFLILGLINIFNPGIITYTA